MLGGLIVSATLGLLAAGILTGGFGGIGDLPSGVCGPGEAGTPFPPSGGQFESDATVGVEVDCGTVEIAHDRRRTTWTVEGVDEARPRPEHRSRRRDARRRAARRRRRRDSSGSAIAGSCGCRPSSASTSHLTVDAGVAVADLVGARLGVVDVELNAGHATVNLRDVREIDGIDVGLNAGILGLYLPAVSTTGSIEANAGSIRLCAPEGVALRLHTGDSVLSSQDFGDAGLVQNGDAWETPGYDTAVDPDRAANRGQCRLVQPRPGGGLLVSGRGPIAAGLVLIVIGGAVPRPRGDPRVRCSGGCGRSRRSSWASSLLVLSVRPGRPTRLNPARARSGTMRTMEGYEAQLATILLGGVIAGLWLLVRGMGGYRTATRIGDTGTSRIASMAAGEVRVSGTIEPAEVTLVSPLQSAPCVYYRAVDRARRRRLAPSADLREERAVGFRVRDETRRHPGVPARGPLGRARSRLDESTGILRRGAGRARPADGQRDRPAELDREAADRRAADGPAGGSRTTAEATARRPVRADARGTTARRAWRPATPVTIVGRAMPFSDLADPAEADSRSGRRSPPTTRRSPRTSPRPARPGSWRTIPRRRGATPRSRASGSGGRCVRRSWTRRRTPCRWRRPRTRPGPSGDSHRARDAWSWPAPRMCRCSSRTACPASAAERHQDRFIVGLLGAVLAIGSAMALAILVSGGFGS